MFGIDEQFWRSTDYAIPIYWNCSVPHEHRVSVYNHAWEHAPTNNARAKLLIDNLHWVTLPEYLE